MSHEDLDIWDYLACPECRRGISVISREECLCSDCGRTFRRTRDIWEMLPLHKSRMNGDVRGQREYYEGPAADSIDRKRQRFSSLHYNKVLGIVNEAGALTGDSGKLRICEIGVGTAIHASWFLEMIPVKGFFGVDISNRTLENGRSRWEGHSEFVPVQGSAYRLPLKDGIFDLVYFSGTLHHCLRPAQAIAEAARILRNGGLLVISEPVWYFPSNLYFNLSIPEESGQRLLKRKNVEHWCFSAGLHVRRFDYFNYLPRPGALEKQARSLEKIISRIPFVRRFSSMFRCVSSR